MNTPTPNPRRRDLDRRCPNESADPSEAVVEAWHNFTGEHAAYRERMGDYAGPPHSRITIEHSCGWSVSFASGPQSWAKVAGAVLGHFGRVEPDWPGRDARIRAEVAEEIAREIHWACPMRDEPHAGGNCDFQVSARIAWKHAGKGFPLPPEPSAVPVEGSGHPQPVRHGTDGHDGYVSPRCAAGMPGCASRGCICRCHIDTPEGATTNEH